jgi:signal transduction histidine kinase/CheY-like chemotaxis protein
MMLIPLCVGCQQRKTYRIGVSQCSQDDWRAKMNDEIEREAMFNEDISVEIRSADDSNEKQISDIRYFADNGFDIIIAAPNEADAITPVIDEVYNKGVPVIIFDRDINDESYTAKISADNIELGESAARYALSLLSGRTASPHALEICGLMGSTPARDRNRGFNQAFAAGGGAVVARGPGNWNQPDAERVADSLLALYPDVDLIFAHNDRMAIGASKMARAKGLNNIKIIGIDAAPNIGIQAVADSVIDATFLYPTDGHILVKTAMNILKGEPYERNIILPTSSSVDLTNARLILLQTESLRHETDKMKALKTRIDDYWEKHSAQTSLLYSFLVIIVLAFITLFLLLRAFWQRKRHQQVLEAQNRLLEEQKEQEKELNRKLQEATTSKLAFYTSVSHDLRTPLTIIAEPISQLANANNLTPRQQILVRIANKNVKILRRLINQILDFRKFENGKLKLNLSEMNFGEAVSEWMESFTEVVRKRDIKLILNAPKGEEIRLAIDAEKMERVFFNLIANAIKFTPDNGTITVSYALEGENLRIAIADTGKGIAAEDINNIFDRFFQVDHVNPQGSGIGLAVVKAFVELHSGTISVESEPGKGSCFTILLPVHHVAEEVVAPVRLITNDDVQAELDRIETSVAEDDTEDEPIAENTDRPQLLVIDDNADIRSLIAQLLGDEYDIHHADNGKVGFAKAVKLVPDLIICDVMMPVMDGMECCRRIKQEVTTSHIPVLMLTACALDEQRIEGYESGADGYIAKPFSGEMLKARCNNLILNRKRVKDIMKGDNFIPTDKEKSRKQDQKAGKTPDLNVANVDPDNEFYARFLKIFYDEISNPDINIDGIASQMGLGHSQFYRKIKALTNYTPVELIRQLRLKQARKLLTSTQKSISEIAYEVGFSSPAYFTKCYRTAFGETPSELRDTLN